MEITYIFNLIVIIEYFVLSVFCGKRIKDTIQFVKKSLLGVTVLVLLNKKICL